MQTQDQMTGRRRLNHLSLALELRTSHLITLRFHPDRTPALLSLPLSSIFVCIIAVSHLLQPDHNSTIYRNLLFQLV
ncbi:hypothetical protein CPB83DRAFT_521022 [Crepidotus variabilis]|uniref:Uncharacterized protein n=1 Tax=Crepidotus variabilis TaxID=179855 RepID=A0A9P6JME8_9AGAR|nr:hypothetical protein CPB83DRAFT_521022 [Crepidotus variabilis]